MLGNFSCFFWSSVLEHFSKKKKRSTIRLGVSNSLDPVVLSVLIWVQTVMTNVAAQLITCIGIIVLCFIHEIQAIQQCTEIYAPFNIFQSLQHSLILANNVPGQACSIPVLCVFKQLSAGPHSAVGNVSGYRCVSDCRSRGREFDPGPAPYFR